MLRGNTVYIALSAIALVFATSWTITNFYLYYPVVQSRVIRAVTGVRTADAAFLQPAPSEVDAFPSIDVYVPAYAEGDVIHQSITSIKEAAYPDHKLNLHVVLEPGDDETHSAVEDLLAKYSFDVLTVPEGYPGTPNKPRAMNYAFEETAGEIVGVIDAENIVDDQLFAQVAAAFVDADVDYLQGRVDMVNEDDGWLNLLFRAEYGFWYRLIVPAFKRLGFPIPLSGTTCFFRRGTLREASELRYERTGAPWGSDGLNFLQTNGFDGYIPWDPTNVTEDFELGLLLWAAEYDFGLIDTVTYEESPQTLTNWMEQRTRWQKGKLYTFVQFFRSPVDSKDKMSHLLWQSFVPHLGPTNILAITLLILIGWIIGFVPELVLVVGVLLLSLAFLVFGVLSFVGGYWHASTKPAGARIGRSVIVATTLPFYWLLQWIADVKAGKKLLANDLNWERTIHKDHARFDEIRSLDDKQTTSLRGLLDSHLRRDFWLYPILTLALVVRLPELTRSLWVDEIYSVQVRGAMNTVGILFAGELHPPLYYLVLKMWMAVFGQSPMAVRSLSVVIGLAVVAATYMLATELYDRSTGFLAALFLALTTIQVHASQEVRMYGMLVLFAVLSLYFYQRLWQADSLDNRFGYGLCTLLMLLTHSYGWFVLFAQISHIGLVAWRRDSFGIAKRWARFQAPVFVFTIPVVLLMVFDHFVRRDANTIGWLTPPDLQVLRDIFLSYSGVPATYPKVVITGVSLLGGLVILAGFVLSLGVLSYQYVDDDASARNVTLLVLVLLSVTAIPYLVSIIAFPVLEVRHALVGSIPFTILLARGVRQLDRQALRMAAVVTIALLLTVGLVSFYQAPAGEDWKSLGETVSEEDLSNDLIIFLPDYTRESTLYYMDEEATQEADTVRYSGDMDLREHIQSGDYERVWIVLRGEPETEEEVAQMLDEEGYQHDSTDSFSDTAVRVELISYESGDSMEEENS